MARVIDCQARDGHCRTHGCLKVLQAESFIGRNITMVPTNAAGESLPPCKCPIVQRDVRPPLPMSLTAVQVLADKAQLQELAREFDKAKLQQLAKEVATFPSTMGMGMGTDALTIAKLQAAFDQMKAQKEALNAAAKAAAVASAAAHAELDKKVAGLTGLGNATEPVKQKAASAPHSAALVPAKPLLGIGPVKRKFRLD